MGIRVHTVMGYGLTDVKTENYEIVDERFNLDGMMMCDYDVREEKYSFEKFKNYIESIVRDKKDDESIFEMMDVYLTHAAMNHKDPWFTASNYHHLVHHDIEYGLDNIMCFVPAGCAKEWVRFDSTVDYYMSTLLTDSNFITDADFNDTMNWCKVMDIPFYPYSGYIDKASGEKATVKTDSGKEIDFHNIAYQFRHAEDSIRKELLKLEPNENTIHEYSELKRFLLNSIDCKEHWMEKYTPAIPSEIKAFITFAEIFKDDSTIYQLKPMIYTYWS